MTLRSLAAASAGERAGPIAKQWEGEVVPQQRKWVGRRNEDPPHLPRAVARVPFLSPRFAGGEDA